MTTSPQDPTPPTKSQRPRWRRKRYWILGLVVLLLLAMSPNFGVWYRRHQMIQHLFGGYGKENSIGKSPQYFLAQEAWPRKYLDWINITPFDRLALADLVPQESTELKWIAGEDRLTELSIFFPVLNGGDDAGFEALAGLNSLEWLVIREVSLRDSGLKHIKGLPKLRFLELGLRDASPGIVELSGHPTIQDLSFRESKNFVDSPEARIELGKVMTAAVLATRDMPRLKHLSFVGAADASAYEVLSTNPNLSELEISSANLDLKTMSSLARIQHLKELVLWKCQIEPGAFAGLNGSHVQKVEVTGIEYPLPELLRGVDTLPNLRTLEGSRPESDEEIALLAKCLPRLEKLKLGDTSDYPEWHKPGSGDEPVKEARGKITDEGLKHLSSLSHLTDLDLGRNLITGASIETLGHMQQLKDLNMGWTRFSLKDWRRLQELLPNTRVQPPYGSSDPNDRFPTGPGEVIPSEQ